MRRVAFLVVIILLGGALGVMVWQGGKVYHDYVTIMDTTRDLQANGVTVAGRLEYVTFEPSVRFIESSLDRVRVENGCTVTNDEEFLVFSSILIRCGGPRSLSLANIDVGNKSMLEIAKMHRLRKLNLTNTKVSDDGINALSVLSLERLCLGQTMITDASVPMLSKMTSLRLLIIDSTLLTCSGIERLKEALPKCNVETDRNCLGPPSFPFLKTTRDDQRKPPKSQSDMIHCGGGP